MLLRLARLLSGTGRPCALNASDDVGDHDDAYGDSEVPGTLDVSATVAGDELWVIITDIGLGLRPRPDSPGLGLGLAIIAQLADGVDLVRPAEGGLELRMRFGMAEKAA